MRNFKVEKQKEFVYVCVTLLNAKKKNNFRLDNTQTTDYLTKEIKVWFQ